MEFWLVQKMQRRPLSSHKMQLCTCLIDRYLQCVDGFWGAQVDAKTNAFNGMIGMIQRQVCNINVNCVSVVDAGWNLVKNVILVPAIS